MGSVREQQRRGKRRKVKPSAPFDTWGGPPVTARHRGRCPWCRNPIRKGTRVRWRDPLGWVHVACCERAAWHAEQEQQPAGDVQEVRP